MIRQILGFCRHPCPGKYEGVYGASHLILSLYLYSSRKLPEERKVYILPTQGVIDLPLQTSQFLFTKSKGNEIVLVARPDSDVIGIGNIRGEQDLRRGGPFHQMGNKQHQTQHFFPHTIFQSNTVKAMKLHLPGDAQVQNCYIKGVEEAPPLKKSYTPFPASGTDSTPPFLFLFLAQIFIITPCKILLMP